MKHGVVIAHGPFGKAIIEAVESIMGSAEGVFPLSVTEMSVKDIESRLSSIINEPKEGVDGIVIMACLRGGSSWNVSAALAKGKDHVRVLSGVNLGMLLTFLIKRDSMSLDDLVDDLLQEGKNGITKL